MKPMLIGCNQNKCGEEFVSWSSSNTGEPQPDNLPVQKSYCYFCPNKDISKLEASPDVNKDENNG